VAFAPAAAAAVTVELFDFSYDRPTPAQIRAAGRVGVIRYVASGRPAVSADRAEVNSYRAAGLTFVGVWEHGAGRALGGWEAGLTDAADAAAYTAGLGTGPTDVVYFAVDVDVTAAQMPAVAEYITGCAAVIGWYRVGAYGEYDVMAWLREHTACRWYWQTAAWSGGRLAPFAQLYQYLNGQTLNGLAVDYDRATAAHYGQWGDDMQTPADLGWGDPRQLTGANMVSYDVGGGVRLAVRNADVGVVMAELVRQLMAAGWDGPADAEVDDWGYARRLKRWAQDAGQVEATAPLTSWSDHAWGTAIDLDTIPNPMLTARPADMWAHTNMPRSTQAIAARLGLDWGGNWTEPWDPQHFQIAMTPANTAVLAQQIRDQGDDTLMAAAEDILAAISAMRGDLALRLQRIDNLDHTIHDVTLPNIGNNVSAAQRALTAQAAAVTALAAQVSGQANDEANLAALLAQVRADIASSRADLRDAIAAVQGGGSAPADPAAFADRVLDDLTARLQRGDLPPTA
jgi:Domain of unknown function (DUF1906)/D-alanyl-D-alanine carboxypeptidase